MPAASQKTPDRIARMMALHQQGRSAREISEEIGISHGAVNAWLKAAGLEPNGGHGPRKSRTRREPNGAHAVIAAGEQALAEVKAGPLPSDRASVVEYLRHRLEQVAAMAQAFAGVGPNGFPGFEKAIRLEQALAAQIAELAPREVHDPQTDPTNVEAAVDVRQKLERLVVAAERGLKCVQCGGNPFGLRH